MHRYAGFSVGTHDAAIAFIDNDGNIIGNYSGERYDRKKQSATIPKHLVKKLLKCNHRVYPHGFPKGIDKSRKKILRSHGKPADLKFMTDFVDHHKCHAASAFFTRPWESYKDTVVLTMDSNGWDYLVNNNIFTYDKKQNQLVSKFYTRTSVGKMYSNISKAIAIVYSDLKIKVHGGRPEGSVMGLAAFGEPKHVKLIKDYYFESQLDNGLLSHPTTLDAREQVFYDIKVDLKHTRFKNDLIELFVNGNYKPEDLAASLQVYGEELILEYAAIARQYGSKLCLAGGVANNIVVNSKIKDLFDDVWIVPEPGDGGLSLGGAAWIWGRDTQKTRINFLDAYLGHDIQREVNPKEVVDYILENRVCGIANGRAEWGPRALGNRSLIGDVRYDIKDTVNAIKKRQPWRPFGPVILEEEFDKWFEGHTNGYMQYVCKPKHDMKSVIHVDGTSRVQTVPADSRSIIRPILEEYFERTGIPMLLNTSLNIKGEPMLNDENHAKEFEEIYNVKVF